MSEPHLAEVAHEQEPVPETGSGAARSLVDRLAEKNAHSKKHLDRAIPVEWDGRVVVRFGRVSRKTLIRSAQRDRGSDIQLVAEACREVFVKDDEGQLQPLREVDGGEQPVRFDGRLADMFKLGDKADTPQKIVLRMYGNEIAITAAAIAVYEWQTGSNLDQVDLEEVEDMLGEDEAAT